MPLNVSWYTEPPFLTRIPPSQNRFAAMVTPWSTMKRVVLPCLMRKGDYPIFLGWQTMESRAQNPLSPFSLVRQGGLDESSTYRGLGMEVHQSNPENCGCISNIHRF